MPRSTIANRVGRIYDKFLELYVSSTAAIAATTTGTPLNFEATKSIEYAAVINPTAYTGYVTGTTAWTISLQAATALAGPYKTITTIELDGTAAQRFLALSGVRVNDVVPLASYLQVVATKVGTPGPLQFGAFLTDID